MAAHASTPLDHTIVNVVGQGLKGTGVKMTKTSAKIRHASTELHVKTRSGILLAVASLIPGAGYVVIVRMDGMDRDARMRTSV